MKEPELTIRVGQELIKDVKDYIVIIRDGEDGLITMSSSKCWAAGAMQKSLCEINASNEAEAYDIGDEDE